MTMRNVEGDLRRVNRLGAATESFFSRLYSALRRRPPSEQAQRLQTEKARMIAERNKRLRETLRDREGDVARLNGILAALDDGIIMQDLEGRIVLINGAAQQLLGTQKNFWETELGMLFDRYREVTKLDTELAPLGEPSRIQVNNRILGAQLAAVGDERGERLGTMIVLRDVTQDAVADRLKDQFVTAISHELRTPMTVIKGAAEILAGISDDQPLNRRLLETLSRNVDTLDRMVVELLDISEMGAGTFTVRDQRIPMEPLVWSVVNGMLSDVKRTGVDITVMVRDNTLLTVAGDEQRLRWALGHLLQNSLRYTERNGHVVVAVGLDPDTESFMTVQVLDTGVGISEKDLPHIFERFYRGEPRNREGRLLDPRGLGQGLYIARTVAQAHGGYLAVHSAPGEGSLFVLALPIVPADQPYTH